MAFGGGAGMAMEDMLGSLVEIWRGRGFHRCRATIQRRRTRDVERTKDAAADRRCRAAGHDGTMNGIQIKESRTED